jgi:hypothetical protein
MMGDADLDVEAISGAVGEELGADIDDNELVL